MENRRGVTIVRAVAEVLLIAVGVILGLVADSWLRDAEERRQALEYMDGLSAEMLTNQAYLLEVLSEERRRQVRGERLLVASRGGPTLPSDSIAILMRDVFGGRMFALQAGTASQLGSAGGLGLITDPEVRQTLGNWNQIVELVPSFNEARAQSWTNVIEPFFVSELELEDWYLIRQNRQATSDLQDAIRSTPFRNAVAARLSGSADLVRAVSGFYTPATDSLLAALERVRQAAS